MDQNLVTGIIIAGVVIFLVIVFFIAKANTTTKTKPADGATPEEKSFVAKLNYIFFTDKHPHFDPRDSHNHTPGHNGSTNPTATGANGGFNGGGSF